jgi:putative transposase
VLLTVCVEDRRPLLANETTHTLLLKAWDQARTWRVGRYVIMPDHLHVFCAAFDISFRLEQWVRYWKSWSARNWPDPTQTPVWQARHWDTRIRSVDHFREKWDYVQNNPVRKGLVSQPEDWPFAGEIERLEWR